MTKRMIHKKQHLVESSYRCEECGKSFYSRGELDDHIHQIHGI
jgi:DNA-directed RNA polymerase subunit RPC12/RpoP